MKLDRKHKFEYMILQGIIASAMIFPTSAQAYSLPGDPTVSAKVIETQKDISKEKPLKELKETLIKNHIKWNYIKVTDGFGETHNGIVYYENGKYNLEFQNKQIILEQEEIEKIISEDKDLVVRKPGEKYEVSNDQMQVVYEEPKKIPDEKEIDFKFIASAFILFLGSLGISKIIRKKDNKSYQKTKKQKYDYNIRHIK